MLRIDRSTGWAALVLLAFGATPGLLAQDEIYVSNGFASSVTVYARNASGDTAPKRTIVGATTGFSGVEKLAVDPLHGEILVANEAAGSVTVHALGANGDVVPSRTIAGANTLLDQSDVPFVDLLHNEIFVTSNNAGVSEAVRVFSRTANGDVAPLRNLVGATTQLNDPQGLWVDLVNNELYVANGQGGDKILVFARTASGNAAPLRTLTGAATLLSQPEGIVVDTVHDELIVANNGTGSSDARITIYARTASGDTAPIRQIAGVNTGFTFAEDVALDLAHDELFVVDDQTDSVRVFQRTANGNVVPLRVLAGLATGMDGPQGIEVIPWIFADGFELGDKTRWSSSVP